MTESAFGVEHTEGTIAKAKVPTLKQISGLKVSGVAKPNKNLVGAGPKWSKDNNTWNRGYTQNLDRMKMSVKHRKTKTDFGSSSGAAQRRLGR